MSEEISSDVYFDLINHVRLSIQHLHSTKPPPCFGRMNPDGPGSPEFSPPYTCIKGSLAEGSTEDLITQMHLIEILSLKNATISWKVFLILHSLPNLLSTLTTLVLRNPRFTQQTGGYEGTAFSARLARTIAHNRQKWRKDALQHRLLHYQVGLQLQQDSKGVWERLTGLQVFMSHRDEICLSRDVIVVAMVYIPHYGKIVPTLLAKGLTNGVGNFMATLLQWSWNNRCQEVCNMKIRAGPSKGSEWVPLEFDTFPEVAPGCYQVHIHVKEDNQYVFKKLMINFIPTYWFQFSLQGPEGRHCGKFTFARPGA
ncbi:hypothetical protein PM082_023630 [Marasmius tenuissimus]|nr:hypothetical protein PM082_023630 [Marasmius tenuissimus]